MSPPRCEKRGSSAAMLRASLVFHRGRYHNPLHLWPPVHLHAPRSICMYLYHYSFNYSHIYWSWNRLISAYWMGIGCLTNSLIDHQFEYCQPEGHCQRGRRRSLVPSTKWRKCHEVGTRPGKNSVHVFSGQPEQISTVHPMHLLNHSGTMLR